MKKRSLFDAGGSEEEATELNCGALFEQYAELADRGLMVVDRQRNVQRINTVAREMLAYQGEVPAPAVSVFRDIEVDFAVGDAFHDRRPVTCEAYAPHPDRLLKFRMIPIIGQTTEPLAVVTAIDDVTRLRHLETVRRDFVANVSHELRTPITSINLLVQTLQNGALEDREAASHFLQRIEVETHSMGRLVEELLELSRLESGRLALALTDVDAKEVLEGVMNRLMPAARDKSLEIHLDVQEGLPHVQADPERLEQILMNLMHNAIKFTPPGGQVTLRAGRTGRGVQVEVVDTGIGMDTVEAARVFERFYKIDKGRNRAEGMGLGLAIARHLVELHGGRLHVVSEPGRGSRFSFALPRAT